MIDKVIKDLFFKKINYLERMILKFLNLCKDIFVNLIIIDSFEMKVKVIYKFVLELDVIFFILKGGFKEGFYLDVLLI